VNRDNAIAVLIHDQVGQLAEGVFKAGVSDNLFRIVVGQREADSLVAQLTGPDDGPPRISVGFGLDVISASFSPLLDAVTASGLGKEGDLRGLIDKLKSDLGEKLTLLKSQRDGIAALIAAESPADLRDAAKGLFEGVVGAFKGTGGAGGSAADSVSRLRQLLGNDVGIALPLATMITAVQRGLQDASDIPWSVEQGLLSYFFRAEGFQTVDKESVVAPVHLSDVKQAVVGALEQRDLSGLQLRGLFSKTTAERYLRDIIRVIVECAYDSGRQLGSRFGGVVSDLRRRSSQSKSADSIEARFVTWYRGFSAMAESAAMRAVEVGTQGVSQFQTNPLIAASAGSFAGTVARKIAQDSFLGVLRTELDRPGKRPGG
jgi:hypothetical protein